MNRFFDISFITSQELLPAELQKLNLPATHPQFRLVGTLRFHSDIAGGVIVVPDGMISDLASIPQQLQWFLSNDDPRISGPAWIHDYLCDMKGKVTLEDGKEVTLTSTQCAQILAHEGMADMGAGFWLRNEVFNCVNVFGPHF